MPYLLGPESDYRHTTRSELPKDSGYVLRRVRTFAALCEQRVVFAVRPNRDRRSDLLLTSSSASQTTFGRSHIQSHGLRSTKTSLICWPLEATAGPHGTRHALLWFRQH